MAFVVAGLLLPWAVVGLLGWFAYRLTVQHGHDLLRIEALQEQVRQLGAVPVSEAASVPRAGLPVGTILQDFELPDLDERGVTLHQWRGRTLLLIFFDPHCPFCLKMLPRLAALSPEPAGSQPMAVVLTTGDPQENRDLFEAHGIRIPVLLQEEMEVASIYQVTATPAGYLVDEHGATSSELALGEDAILALGTPSPEETRHEVRAPGKVTPQGHRSLAESRLLRTGLTAGTLAPLFRLPLVGGGEVALEEYRGRRVLLVFSDPTCGPCDALVPQLEQIHREFPDVRVLMISRGDAEANRRKSAQHRLTFPVVLQRHWDTSRAYGMFATPIGYLIDEDGVIASNVAVGVDAIVGLVSSARDREEVVPA